MVAEAQPLGDLAIGEAVDDEHRHLLLARRQRGQRTGCEPLVLALELEHRDKRAIV